MMTSFPIRSLPTLVRDLCTLLAAICLVVFLYRVMLLRPVVHPAHLLFIPLVKPLLNPHVIVHLQAADAADAADANATDAVAADVATNAAAADVATNAAAADVVSPTTLKSANSTTPISAAVRTPLPFSAVVPPLPASPTIVAAFPFTQPRIISTYVRPSLSRAAPAHDLFVFTTALLLRRLNVTACVLDGATIAVDTYMDETTTCILPRPPRNGASLTLLLDNDAPLRLALTKDFPLPGAVVAKRLRPGVDVRKRASGEYALARTVTLRKAHLDTFDTQKAEGIPRYSLCQATMVRNGGDMLLDWVDHHRRLGVDHTLIFDNGATPSPRDTFAGRDDVEVLVWPWAKTQVQAFAVAMITARRRCRYMFLSDVDEFVLVGLGKTPFADGRRPFHAVVADFERRGFVHMQFRNLYMVNSGYLKKPTGHVPELYTHTRSEQELSYAKSVCAADWDWRAGRIHCCGMDRKGLRPPRYMVKVSDVDESFAPSQPSAAPLMVHFFERSWEEFVEKWNIGTAVVLNRLKRDMRQGRFSVDEPVREHIDVDRPGIRRYTVFRDFWRRVRDEAADRLHESVLVWTEDGRLVTRVVGVKRIQ